VTNLARMAELPRSLLRSSSLIGMIVDWPNQISQLDAEDVIPTEIEGVMIDVKEVGEIRALT
jgi:hypothetical protein